MKILKKELLTFKNLLDNTELSLSNARIRDTVSKQIDNLTEQFEKERSKIIVEFCDKDVDGNPIVNDNQCRFSNNFEQFTKEFELLLSEEVDVEIKDQEKIKEFIESTNYKPKTGETEIIDQILNKLCLKE